MVAMELSYCTPLALLFVLMSDLSVWVGSVELTFELPDNAKECFFENIEKGTNFTLEFQVVTGGNYDVDVSLEAPTKALLYKAEKKQYDSQTYTAYQTGVYAACFSNEFSSFTHKLVYINFEVGDEEPLPGIGEKLSAMTQLESSSQEVHENLNAVLDFQTHHRLRETQGRKRAEDLNRGVFNWGLVETLSILLVGFGQVFVLRNFFAEKKPSQMNAHM